MSSTNKTSLGLNVWEASDKPVRQDFVNDNVIINEKITKLNSDLTVKDVISNFTGSKDCSVNSAKKYGNIISLRISIGNIPEGWSQYPLTSTYTLAQNVVGIVHNASSSDINKRLTCQYAGSYVSVLASAALTAGVDITLTLMVN